MITGMMIPVVFYACNLRFFKAAFIASKYGQPKKFNHPPGCEILSTTKSKLEL